MSSILQEAQILLLAQLGGRQLQADAKAAPVLVKCGTEPERWSLGLSQLDHIQRRRPSWDTCPDSSGPSHTQDDGTNVPKLKRVSYWSFVSLEEKVALVLAWSTCVQAVLTKLAWWEVSGRHLPPLRAAAELLIISRFQ